MHARKQVPAGHPLVGENHRLLADDEPVRAGDETARVSELLAFAPPYWRPVTPDAVGRAVSWLCDEAGDAGGHERLFRRRTAPPWEPYPPRRVWETPVVVFLWIGLVIFTMLIFLLSRLK
jgi:hypothetical protein